MPVPARHRRTLLTVLLCAAPCMTVLDANVVAIALPSLRDDLQFSWSGVQWVIGAYSLAFGSTLLLAGRAADLYGRRRLLVLGLGLFSAAALAGAVAPTREVLLCARAAQGIGAAMAFPASLALIAQLFARGEQRNRALGVYGALISVAFVWGMIAGGLLTASLGWRATLLITVPIGGAAALATLRLVPVARPAAALPRPGLPGVLAAGAGALTLLYGLGLAARPGERAAGVAVIVSAIVLLGAAVRVECRSPSPLLPPGLLRRPDMASAVVAALLTVGTGVGAVFILTFHLQDVLGYGPLAAGLALTPLGVAGALAGLLVPRIARRTGLSRTLTGALAVQGAGVALLACIGVNRGVGVVVAGVAAFGFGHFAATVAFTALATGVASQAEHGVVTGVISSAQQIGGAMGLAVLAAVASAQATTSREGSDSAQAVVEGFRWALATGAGLSLLAAALVLALSRRPRPSPGRRPASGWRTTPSRGRSSPP